MLLAKCEVIKKRQLELMMENLWRKMGGMSIDRERRNWMKMDDLMVRIAHLKTKYYLLSCWL